jgi:hypothetical protein
METPTLPLAKARYLRAGMGEVKGWLDPSTAVYLASLEVHQRELGITGDIVEIGVFNGRSFLTFALDLPDGETAHAIDLFDEASDGYGLGNRERFEKNLADHGVTANVTITHTDSTLLEASGFLEQGRRFRIVSIDGGHSAEVTASDLRLAEKTVLENGVVVLDDVINRFWLGVATGMFRYWAEGGTLVPAVYMPNKLLLAPDADGATRLREWMLTNFRGGLEKRDVELGPGEIDVYANRRWQILDVNGDTGLPAGVSPEPPERMTSIPTTRLRELERRVPPMRSRLARRMPGLARVVRPVYRRLRGIR